MHDLERWSDIRKLLERPGKITGADFDPDPAILDFLQNDARVLVVGAGKAACSMFFKICNAHQACTAHANVGAYGKGNVGGLPLQVVLGVSC